MEGKNKISKKYFTGAAIFLLCIIVIAFFYKGPKGEISVQNTDEILKGIIEEHIVPFNKEDFNTRLLSLANASTVFQKKLWPASTTLPLSGAVLPFRRIIAYYGNFYSTQMGILGEYPEPEVFRRLNIELQKWNAADPETPAIPAIQYITVTAQGSRGDDGKYRARMPDKEIDKALAMANEIDGLLILDVQVGLSSLPAELPLLKKYLALPQVHLAIDPEFSMKRGGKPGQVIGTYDASDINYTIDFLAKTVKENKLPPKILVVHRFTRPMVTNYKDIKIVPEVEFVMNMDGWGVPEKKIGTYNQVVYPEPVEFTGFKLFYKNDTKTGTVLMTPEELLTLTPKPIYIQYQ